MKKLAAIILVLWSALVCAAFAPFYVPVINVVSGTNTSPMQSIIFGGYTDASFNPGVNRRFAIFGFASGTSSTNLSAPVPIDGTLDRLNLMFSQTLTGSGAISITLYKNNIATSLTCTVVVGNASCTDMANSVSVVAGDQIQYVTTPVGGTPTGVIQYANAIRFTSDVGNSSILGFHTNNSVTDSEKFSGFGYNYFSPLMTTYNDAYQIMPTDGIIDRLHVRGINLTSGQTLTVTMYKNGNPTSLTCTTSFTNSNLCTDVTNSVSFATGDTIAVRMIASSGAISSPNFTVRWQPNTPKEFPIFSSSPSSLTSGTSFRGPNNGSSSVSTETPQPIPANLTWKKMYGRVITSPGGSSSWVSKARKNLTDTALSCAISGSATTCSDLSNEISYTTSDTISLSTVASSGPSQSIMTFSGVMTIP